MSMERRTRTRLVTYSLGAIIAPYLTLSILIVVSVWLKDFLVSGVTLYVGIPLSTVTGAVFIVLLPVKRWVRLLILVPYLPVVAYLSFFYMLLFVGFVYDEWI